MVLGFFCQLDVLCDPGVDFGFACFVRVLCRHFLRAVAVVYRVYSRVTGRTGRAASPCLLSLLLSHSPVLAHPSRRDNRRPANSRLSAVSLYTLSARPEVNLSQSWPARRRRRRPVPPSLSGRVLSPSGEITVLRPAVRGEPPPLLLRVAAVCAAALCLCGVCACLCVVGDEPVGPRWLRWMPVGLVGPDRQHAGRRVSSRLIRPRQQLVPPCCTAARR